jgi:mono/diheme cytochrome c family protein
MLRHPCGSCQSSGDIRIERRRDAANYGSSLDATVLEPAGDVDAGREVFESRCAACHNGGGIAPTLVNRKGKISVSSIVSSLWTHGP